MRMYTRAVAHGTVPRRPTRYRCIGACGEKITKIDHLHTYSTFQMPHGVIYTRRTFPSYILLLFGCSRYLPNTSSLGIPLILAICQASCSGFGPTCMVCMIPVTANLSIYFALQLRGLLRRTTTGTDWRR